VSKWSPRWTFTFNHASGDGNSGDRVRTTFDTLFPSNHDKYGLMDRFSWRNLNDAQTGVEFDPAANWRIRTVVHYFWLANKNDGIYSRSGLVVRAVNPTNGRLGPEFDVQVTRGFGRHLEVTAGYAHLWAGKYILEATRYTGSSYPFVSWTCRI
jgi:hypothetical protein